MPMRPSTRALSAAVVLTTALIAPTAARAGFIIEKVIVQEIPDPVFQYQIGSVVLTGSTVIHKHDYFTVYDFPFELIQGSNIQPGPLWAANVPYPYLGTTPPGLANPPTDSPDLLNVTWRYLGDDPIKVPVGQTQFSIGLFMLTGVSEPDVFPDFFEYSYKAGTEVGTGKSPVTVQLVVPEPHAALLLGTGLPPLALALLWARRPRSARATG